MRVVHFFYFFVLILFTIFSYGFVDANFPLFQGVNEIVRNQKLISTVVYCLFLLFFFAYYLLLLIKAKKNEISFSLVWRVIMGTTAILFFSFPAYSYDIFNYIATAKLSFIYQENPYLVMPIEITHEPLLAFMHAANKTALYGPIWIVMTVVPLLLGFNNLLVTILTFKLFIAIFYLATAYTIYRVTKSVFSLVFFALNPLVVIEVLVSAHNDVVMIFLALMSFLLLFKKRYIASLLFIVLSVGIKFATLFLLPVYLYVFFQIVRKKHLDQQKIWLYASVLMYSIFLLSPLREELYSWYFIWPLTFVSLLKPFSSIQIISVVFSAGLLLRFAPYVYTREWGGVTPVVKFLVSYIPPLIVAGYVVIKRFGGVRKILRYRS